MVKLINKVIEIIKITWRNYDSLLFSITIKILLIAIPVLVSMAIWTSWKVDRLLMTTSQQTVNLAATHFAKDMEETHEFTDSLDTLQTMVDRWSSPTMWFWVKQADSKVMVQSKQLNSKLKNIQPTLMSLQLLPAQFRRYQMAGYHLTIASKALSGGNQLYIAQDVTELQLDATAIIRNLAIGIGLFLPALIILTAYILAQSLQPFRQFNQLLQREVGELTVVVNDAKEQQKHFADRISHELRTPLSLVYGYLQSLLRRGNNLTDFQRQALQTATQEAERMVQILQNLLDRARENQPQNYKHQPELMESLSCASGDRTAMTPTAHILLVEDEIKLARFIELELCSEGYRVSVAHDGMSGLILARETSPDLLILDWMLPGLTGVELCRRLRTTGIKAPAILLTARDEVSDRVAGLDAGADDYVVKPFSIEELLARIRAHLRRTKEDKDGTDLLQFQDISLNRRTREVLRGQRSIELTVKEFDLLDYLLSHPRQVLTKEQILEKVWGYDFMGDSNIIEVYIRYLRLKLEEGNEKRLIHTVRGVGYCLRE